MKRMDVHISNVPNVVAACVVLHNFCELHGDYCQQDWECTNDLSNDQSVTSSPSTSTSTTAADIRYAHTRYLNQ